MSDFMESEAEESGEELDETKEQDENEEEEEEGDAQEVVKDLIDDNPIDEEDDEESSGDDEGPAKKRAKVDDDGSDDDDVDDDDLALIAENTGIKIKKKKTSRLKLLDSDESEGDDDEPEKERDAIAHDIFKDDEDSQEEEGSTRPTSRQSAAAEYTAVENVDEGSDDEGDEIDDFIVDDDGAPKKKGKKKRSGLDYDDSALAEAQDLFGLEFDLSELDIEMEDDDDDDINEEDLEEEELIERMEQKKAKKKGGKMKLTEVFEPAELERGFMTTEDNKIKITDVPERFQLRITPVKMAEEAELLEEAEWIYKQAFMQPPISQQSFKDPNDSRRNLIGFEAKPVTAIPRIKAALSFMRKEMFEVPFIAMYRKEYVAPELKQDDLWKVYDWDEKWMVFLSRKQNMKKLFEQMQAYQFEYTKSNPDLPLQDGFRLLDQEDIDRLENAQSPEELMDVYMHFKLYYGDDLPAMQEWKQTQVKRIRKTKKKVIKVKKVKPPKVKKVKVVKEPSSELTQDQEKQTPTESPQSHRDEAVAPLPDSSETGGTATTSSLDVNRENVDMEVEAQTPTDDDDLSKKIDGAGSSEGNVEESKGDSSEVSETENDSDLVNDEEKSTNEESEEIESSSLEPVQDEEKNVEDLQEGEGSESPSKQKISDSLENVNESTKDLLEKDSSEGSEEKEGAIEPEEEATKEVADGNTSEKSTEEGVRESEGLQDESAKELQEKSLDESQEGEGTEKSQTDAATPTNESPPGTDPESEKRDPETGEIISDKEVGVEDNSSPSGKDGETSKEMVDSATSQSEESVEEETEEEEESEYEDQEIEVTDSEAEPEPEATEASKRKLPRRRDLYIICKDNGLAKMKAKFGLTAEQFGENMRDNYQRHEPVQYQQEPLEAAEEFICNTFPSPEAVLGGARHMVAVEISRDPLVKHTVRQIFYERAKISITATAKGVKDISDYDENGPFKYIKNKPVNDLQGEQFLKMCVAEESGLVKMKIGIDQSEHNLNYTFLDEVKQLYHRDEFSHLVQEWNKQRGEALSVSLNKILYPIFEKELKNKLLTEAKDFAINAAKMKLRSCISIAPYQPENAYNEEDDFGIENESSYCRVLGISFQMEKEEADFGALIDTDGQVIDTLRFKYLTFFNPRFEEEHQSRSKEFEMLKNFVKKHQPRVIGISAESGQAERVMNDISRAMVELEQEQQMAHVYVELVDGEVARIFQNSPRGEAEFRDYPVLLRHAISIARRLQEPLVEFAGLTDQEDELLCLRLHPYQEYLDKDVLKRRMTTEFISQVNMVGVDINRCLEYPHRQILINYLCGLGPRKAALLMRTLRAQGSRLENRSQLVTVCEMGLQVFLNCAGFIRIEPSEINNDKYEVLDGTRIHPETYDWPRKMAIDALEYDEGMDDSNPSSAVEEILEQPDRLKDLDLDAFAEELARQGYGNRQITLYDIRDELINRFKDHRTVYTGLSSEERFRLLTGETPQTFYVGVMITCKVVRFSYIKPSRDELDTANPTRNDDTNLWKCPFCLQDTFPDLSEVWTHFDNGSCLGKAIGVKTFLPNGIMGFIHNRNISDKKVNRPEERVKVGMTLYCRVLKIDHDRLSVDLTCKSSDLADAQKKFCPPKDLYFDQELYDRDRKKQDAVKEAESKKTTYLKRVIAHPSFKNVTFKDAEKLLESMDQGECIVRPSSKGSDHLTVTWKVHGKIYQHIDIREEQKQNEFSIGKSLWIDNEEFEDLDEILTRHINPLATHTRELCAHKYFKESDGTRPKLDEFLVLGKRENPGRIPYFFTTSKQYPGKFMIGYMPRNKPRVEFVSVTVDGFKYRGRIHANVNNLLKWFKEHFRDPVPGVGTPGSSRRTPYGQTPMSMMGSVAGTPYTPGSTPSDLITNDEAAKLMQQAFPSNAYNAGFGGSQSGTPRSTPGYSTPAFSTPGGFTPQINHMSKQDQSMDHGSSGGGETPNFNASSQPQYPSDTSSITPGSSNTPMQNYTPSESFTPSNFNNRPPQGSNFTPQSNFTPTPMSSFPSVDMFSQSNYTPSDQNFTPLDTPFSNVDSSSHYTPADNPTPFTPADNFTPHSVTPSVDNHSYTPIENFTPPQNFTPSVDNSFTPPVGENFTPPAENYTPVDSFTPDQNSFNGMEFPRMDFPMPPTPPFPPGMAPPNANGFPPWMQMPPPPNNFLPPPGQFPPPGDPNMDNNQNAFRNKNNKHDKQGQRRRKR